MGRGVSCGGGKSQLNYLFGNAETTPPAEKPAPSAPAEKPPPVAAAEKPPPAAPAEKPAPSAPADKPSPPVDHAKLIPAGIKSEPSNNYFRADGQNSGNFITDRPSTKVHAAPGGGSSLGYLFGGGKN